MAKDPAKKRHTYQIVVPEELALRMDAIRKEMPGLPSPAPFLRTALEKWCEGAELGMRVAREGGTEEDLRKVAAMMLGEMLMEFSVTTQPGKEGKAG